MAQSDDTSRADAALERIAAAKEDAAKSAKFAVLLSNRQQLTCPQRAAVAAIADTFIDSFLPAQPRSAFRVPPGVQYRYLLVVPY